MKYAILALALVGCQQQSPIATNRPCPEACECDLCKCKELCSCGTEVAKNIESLRGELNEVRRRLADRQAVSGGSVRRVEATPPKQYTGIAVYVADPAATIQERSTCEPCNQLVRDVRSFGTSWRVGGLADHFAVIQAEPTDYTPLLIAYRDGVELWREAGYTGDIESLVRRNPRVDAKSLVRSSSTTQPTTIVHESAPVVQSFSSPVVYDAAPVYQSAPAFSWGVQFGQPAYQGYGYGRCVNGVCQ